MAAPIERIEISTEEIGALLESAKAALTDADYSKLEKLVNSFVYMTHLLEKKGTTIRHLRKLLFGFKSEKLKKIIESLEGKPAAEDPVDSGDASAETPSGSAGDASDPKVAANGPEPAEDEGKPEKKPKGHGRNPADAYEGAERIRIEHETLKHRDPCPEPGCTGKVYEVAQPVVMVRVVGQAPLGARVIELQQLRCNLCLKVFTAKAPEDLTPEKYDETAASMVAVLRYGTGVPHNRLERLQQNLGIPLPASTQWDIVAPAAKKVAPAYAELIRQAAQDDVFHNDDTPMKILELMKKRKGDDG
jgi:transposase